MKPKEPRDKGIFRPVSAREVFYYIFAVLLIAIGLACWGWFGPDSSDKPRAPEDYAADAVGEALSDAHFVPLSDGQVLIYEGRGDKTNAWRIYDATSHTIAINSDFARAFENDPSAHSKLSNDFSLSSCNGNIVLAIEGRTNSPTLIYEWATNSDKLQVFNWNDFKGSQRALSHMDPRLVVATKDGWLYSAVGVRNGISVSTAGPGINSGFATFSFPSNLEVCSAPVFQGGIYLSAFDTNTLKINIYVLDCTNQSILYSNTQIKPPLEFDVFNAYPNYFGNRILWRFCEVPTVALKIHNVLPGFLAKYVRTDLKIYDYWSDLDVTKFHFIASKKTGWGLDRSFCWGTNGDSIWLPDDKYGVKRYDLK